MTDCSICTRNTVPKYARLTLYSFLVLSLLMFCDAEKEDMSIKTSLRIANSTWNILPKIKDKKLGRVANMDSLQKFFKRYESDAPISYSVEVTEEDFLLGKNNAMKDFGISEDIARAIFRLLNVDYASKLFIIDTDLRVLLAFWDKRITQKEFIRAFFAVLRPLPLASIFLRFDSDANEVLDKLEFYEMANSWDINSNAKINDVELGKWWSDEGYGEQAEAEQIFKVIDKDENGILDDRDFKILWNYLSDDTSTLVDFDEFVHLDALVNGEPEFRKNGEGKKRLLTHSTRFREFEPS